MLIDVADYGVGAGDEFLQASDPTAARLAAGELPVELDELPRGRQEL